MKVIIHGKQEVFGPPMVEHSYVVTCSLYKIHVGEQWARRKRVCYVAGDTKWLDMKNLIN